MRVIHFQRNVSQHVFTLVSPELVEGTLYHSVNNGKITLT